ncbi:MAG: TIGR04282 family arsenosugar biosynthesis glycosyltransferase [Ignavibacteria bacterium]
MSKHKVIIFLKYPEVGKVKTRMAESLGGNFAAEFYKICAEYILNECLKLKESGIDLYIFYEGQANENKIKNWVPGSFKLICQKGENLGKRMYNAFSNFFKDKEEKIILIGTDIPDLSSSLIEKAFKYLENHDTVIGQSSDGGYYLIGLSRLNKDIFTGIPWSTDKVLVITLKKLEKRNSSYKLLPELIDIDTEADIVSWLKRNPAGNHPVKEYLNSQNFNTGKSQFNI